MFVLACKVFLWLLIVFLESFDSLSIVLVRGCYCWLTHKKTAVICGHFVVKRSKIRHVRKVRAKVTAAFSRMVRVQSEQPSKVQSKKPVNGKGQGGGVPTPVSQKTGGGRRKPAADS